jgi:cation diffusion facilitator CzcD-associated flavoprotein CzcO
MARKKAIVVGAGIGGLTIETKLPAITVTGSF